MQAVNRGGTWRGACATKTLTVGSRCPLPLLGAPHPPLPRAHNNHYSSLSITIILHQEHWLQLARFDTWDCTLNPMLGLALFIWRDHECHSQVPQPTLLSIQMENLTMNVRAWYKKHERSISWILWPSLAILFFFVFTDFCPNAHFLWVKYLQQDCLL